MVEVAMLIHNCPRCGTKQITFETLTVNWLAGELQCEAFCCCRACKKATIFLLTIRPGVNLGAVTEQGGVVNKLLNRIELVNFIPHNSKPIPEHLPKEIEKPYQEALKCQAIEAHNAAGCMFRTTVDLVTKQLLQNLKEKTSSKNVESNLAQRIKWLCDEKQISDRLKELSNSIRLDGNDAVHQANLMSDDVEEMNDFTTLLLLEIYTTPKEIELADDRRKERRRSGDEARETLDPN